MEIKEGRKVRERGGSFGNIEEILKRKKEEEGEKEEGGEKEESGEGTIFNRSKKTLRLPMKGRAEEEGSMKEIIKSWRGEMEEIMKKIRRMKGWKEEIRQIRKEVREGIREQGRIMKEEIKEIKKEDHQ